MLGQEGFVDIQVLHRQGVSINLHALAYQMFVRLRDYLHGTPWHKLEIETLRRRVLKIGARIRQTTRRIWVHLSSAFPEQPLFHLVLSRLNSS